MRAHTLADPHALGVADALPLTLLAWPPTDFFSVTFGLCGITQPQSAICDFSPSVRRELGDWFRSESVTSTWIRATSPKCNYSHKWPIPLMDGPESAPAPAEFGGGAEEWPAYPTCAAGRPDHGSDGAYPSWPAFALEALCYVDGNCSSAFEIMGTFAQATWEGPFGQAHQVPQLGTAPYVRLASLSLLPAGAQLTSAWFACGEHRRRSTQSRPSSLSQG